ncbi:MAG: hypothetical protein COW12_04470 [Candidatus Omnitrophica bacterium CG12_big_fil_rev_8_21_14_0_65_45_16]|nr:MAG: hypothetical protein COW12_04470 [Candidatus Omnitrophica bacterium CG12_big_fil_rev_8_21_14_0_65_45_16]
MGCDAQPSPAASFDRALVDYMQQSSKDQRLIMEAIDKAIDDARSKLELTNKDIKTVEARIESLREESAQLLNLALKGAVSTGVTYKEKMEQLETEIATLELQLDKLEAQKKTAEIALGSCKFLHGTLVIIMANFDVAPPETQKMFIQALISGIVARPDALDVQMFFEKPPEEPLPENVLKSLAGTSPKENRPTKDNNGEAVITNVLGSPERQE